MNWRAPLQADAEAIRSFVDALFRYAEPGTFASLRAFFDTQDGVFRIWPCQIGEDLGSLAAAAEEKATAAARAVLPVVFAPPIATFNNPDQAREADLANGLALSVECDATPAAARARLEAILGPATVVVASGGEWTNHATGELEPKLHLHWRLTEVTTTAEEHARLKLARSLAARLVGADTSNMPMVHPIRWPGTWHRKAHPRLARIEALREAVEIDLGEALEKLQEAAKAAGINDQPKQGNNAGTGEARSTAELIRAVLSAEDYHAPLATLAMRFLTAGAPDAQAVLMLQGIMLAVSVADRDMKDGTAEPGRWQARYDDIPRAVSTARAKIGERSSATPEQPGGAWPEPIDFLADNETAGVPVLRPDHLPDAIAPFIFDTAERMGVEPASAAIAAIVSIASVINDDWQIQPKQHDTTWTEQARLWGAIIGPPSILKTPVLRAASKPVDRLEVLARQRHGDAMRKWKQEVAAIKAGKNPAAQYPPQPRCDRYLAESVTVEALSEILRDDDEAKFRAPARKVLARMDELSEWVASLDQYKAGGRGGADRGAYLRLYNGGRHTVDRIGRGSFAIPNWSACLLGGIQPQPIQRIAKDAADDGLLQRFVFIVPGGRGADVDRAPNTDALERYAALFPALNVLGPPRHLSGEGKPVVLDAGAQQQRLAINAVLKAHAAMPDVSGQMQAALEKWPGTWARLALVFHLVEIADANAQTQAPPPMGILRAETAGRAAGFMREVLLPHLLRAEALLYSTTQAGHVHWVAGLILASEECRKTQRITVREVQRAYRPLRAADKRRELVEVLTALEVAGWLRVEPRDNLQQPLTTWHVNPALHATFADRAAKERARRDAAKAEAIRNMQQGRAAA